VKEKDLRRFIIAFKHLKCLNCLYKLE